MQHSGDVTVQDPHEPIFEIESSLQPNSGNNDIIIAHDEEEDAQDARDHAQVQTQDQCSKHQMNVTQTERSDESGAENLLDLTHTVMDKTHSIHDQTHSVNNSAGSDLIQMDDFGGKGAPGNGIQDHNPETQSNGTKATEPKTENSNGTNSNHPNAQPNAQSTNDQSVSSKGHSNLSKQSSTDFVGIEDLPSPKNVLPNLDDSETF
ncbi:hypothetical protein Ddc_16355 [Ditylenchus destructor]|nr:hypothetical protein Ddc_16355 [Ditylenchus destructor]